MKTLAPRLSARTLVVRSFAAKSFVVKCFVAKSFVARSLTIAVCALAVLAASRPAQAQTPSQTAVSFRPNASRYARGTVIQLEAAVRTITNAPVSGAAILVYEASSKGVEYVGGGYASVNGVLRLPYRVPVDPNKDNVFIYAFAYSPVPWIGNSYGCLRIPIGR